MLRQLMQPIRMTVGFVAAPIVGTLGGALVGAYHGGGAVGEFGARLLTALGIDITQVMDPELGYTLAVEYGIQPLEAVNTAVGAGAGAFAVTFLYHAIKTTVIVSKIISAKKAAKISFLGHIGGGKKLDKLVKKINKRVNRKLSKEGYSQVTITNEEISALLVEADRNELYCTGAMKRSRRATDLNKPLRKKLAKSSDIYRYLTNSILEMY